VAVDATGTSDAVTSGKDGLLTDSDSAALAQALGQVIDHPGLKKKLIEGAAKRIDWFDINYQAQRMLQVYDEATVAKKEHRHITVRD
jgi:glycosyltransferase involved in cell wall biosynthesis